LLSTTNPELGSFYELGVYVVGKGDTLLRISESFQVSPQDVIAINPGLNPNILMIGQKIRIYERLRQ